MQFYILFAQKHKNDITLIMLNIAWDRCRRRRRRKIRAQAWSLFARLFNIQKLEYSTSKQFLIIYTSTSSSLNFGTIVVNYFLIRPEFIQSGFKCVSRFCMRNFIRQTVSSLINPSTHPVNALQGATMITIVQIGFLGIRVITC